jgi:hypothetical protein
MVDSTVRLVYWAGCPARLERRGREQAAPTYGLEAVAFD